MNIILSRPTVEILSVDREVSLDAPMVKVGTVHREFGCVISRVRVEPDFLRFDLVIPISDLDGPEIQVTPARNSGRNLRCPPRNLASDFLCFRLVVRPSRPGKGATKK
jgi:hypothetical protein